MTSFTEDRTVPSPDQPQDKPESIWDNGKWVEMAAEALRRGRAEDQARRAGKLVNLQEEISLGQNERSKE